MAESRLQGEVDDDHDGARRRLPRSPKMICGKASASASGLNIRLRATAGVGVAALSIATFTVMTCYDVERAAQSHACFELTCLERYGHNL